MCLFTTISSTSSPSLIESFKFHRQIRSSHPYYRYKLRIIYFRAYDINITETSLKTNVLNLTETNLIDLSVVIYNQSTSLLSLKLCSLLKDQQLNNRRDTIIIADFYTKEIELLSRTLEIPTVVINNRYAIVHGKEKNPYLFKLMPDATEEAKSVARTLETRSVYTRIALIYEISSDMNEYRLQYLTMAKQHIIYKAQLPKISLWQEVKRSYIRKIFYDLSQLDVDLIFCIMSTDREIQFLRLAKEIQSPLLNRTSWWFSTRLGDSPIIRYYHPKVFTASEDRRRTLTSFSSSALKILFNAIIRTYMRLDSSHDSYMGALKCDDTRNTLAQINRTKNFIKYFSEYTTWSCDIRIASGVDPLIFNERTLAWRIPTIFMIHQEYSCQGMITWTFWTNNQNPAKVFSCPPSSSTITNKMTLDLTPFHQAFGKTFPDPTIDCKYVRINAMLTHPTIVGVVEPPYLFVSETEISSEFHCNYGVPCYQIDPPINNTPIDMLYFQSNMTKPPRCCYGISVNLLLRMADSTIGLKTIRLFVFSDVPGKWLALIESLENRRAHLSISPIPYEYYFKRNIDLTYPFYHSSYVILTARQPSDPSLGAFLQPFSWDTWLVIFIILNATALFETFFEWHSPYGLTPKGRRRQKVFSLASALTLSWSIIFSHTFKTKSPKCWSNRFLGNVWGGFGIVFIAIYTAKLAAFMVELGDVQLASDVQGIIDTCRKLHSCTLGVVANTSDEEYLKKYYSTSLYQNVHYVKNYSVGIDSLKNKTITFMLMDHSIARYYTTRDVLKSIRISGDNFGAFGVSLGFSKYDVELKNNITNILLSYMDKGIIQRLHDEWYGYENCEFKRFSKNRKLILERFVGVFILLGGGVLIGLLTLLLEWFTFKYFVPYCREKEWRGWMFCSQRLYAALNVSDDVFAEAYYDSKSHSFKEVGERLHNYSARSDSLDLRVVDVPKLLSTTYRLKQEIDNIKQTIHSTRCNTFNEQDESSQLQFVEEIPLLERPNESLGRTTTLPLSNKSYLNKSFSETQGEETTSIAVNTDNISVTVDQRIQTLEKELEQLRLQLIGVANEKEQLQKELNNALSNKSS